MIKLNDLSIRKFNNHLKDRNKSLEVNLYRRRRKLTWEDFKEDTPKWCQ